MRISGLCIVFIFIAACTNVPRGITPVHSFDVQRYVGTWHEIARLENSFEKDLSHVTAEYNLRGDGGISVKNVGYSPAQDKWKEAVGKAYFIDGPDTGHLKVSFQWPFYSSYVVFKLDPNYEYAYVTGGDRDYLWLLSRKPTVDEAVATDFRKTAEALGFDLAKLVWVDQRPLD